MLRHDNCIKFSLDSYISQTVCNISDLLQPLEDAIRYHMIQPLLVGQYVFTQTWRGNVLLFPADLRKWVFWIQLRPLTRSSWGLIEHQLHSQHYHLTRESTYIRQTLRVNKPVSRERHGTEVATTGQGSSQTARISPHQLTEDHA